MMKMRLMSKMTIKEFQAHYDEYVKNFILNAKTIFMNVDCVIKNINH